MTGTWPGAGGASSALTKTLCFLSGVMHHFAMGAATATASSASDVNYMTTPALTPQVVEVPPLIDLSGSATRGQPDLL